jgi:hypothetical protein
LRQKIDQLGVSFKNLEKKEQVPELRSINAACSQIPLAVSIRDSLTPIIYLPTVSQSPALTQKMFTSY